MRRARWLFWGFLAAFVYGTFAMPLDKLALSAGFPESTLPKIQAVVQCESGGRATAVGDTKLMDGEWGPSLNRFQVRTRWDELFTLTDRNPILNFWPWYNATAAYNISGGGKNWGPWTCG
jgi:hypothetical protein